MSFADVNTAKLYNVYVIVKQAFIRDLQLGVYYCHNEQHSSSNDPFQRKVPETQLWTEKVSLRK
jgi:hypothetical protein